MQLPAKVAVTVEIRTMDAGPAVARAWRLSHEIGEDGLRVRGALPFEPGRPVRVELTLPDDDTPVQAVGVVIADEERPRLVRFTALDDDARRRVARYVQERTITP